MPAVAALSDQCSGDPTLNKFLSQSSNRVASGPIRGKGFPGDCQG